MNAVLTFFLITLCLGYSVLKFSRAKVAAHPLLYALELLGVGLATFSFLGVVLDLLGIPLHLYVYLGLAVIGPAASVLIPRKDDVKRPKSWWKDETALCFLGLLVILLLTFALFHKGAFSYPYLEDDDPWNHAMGTMYVATQHTYDIDPAVRVISGGYAFYLEPYPPTYDVLMGVLRQTNDSVSWTLKLFNTLLLTITLATWYLFASAFFKSERKALFSTAVLAALPSFTSHFIWSQTLAIALFPVGLYAVLRAAEDRTWRIAAIIVIASMMVSQPIISLLFGLCTILIFLLMIGKELLGRENMLRGQAASVFLIGAGGVLLSLLFWGAQFIESGNFFESRQGGLSHWDIPYVLQSYSLGEVLFPPHASRIDQATGWGLAVTLLAILSIGLLLWTHRTSLNLARNWKRWFLLIWFLGLAYIVFAPSFGLPSYGTSRAWAYLAMPLALLATEGTFILAASVSKQELARLGIAAGVLALILLTSLPAKVAVQTSQWPPGVQWTPIQAPNGGVSYPDLEGHAMMGNYIPKNSRVFAFCGGDSRVVGFDMQAEPWDRDQAEFRKRLFNATGEEIVAFLKTHQFAYITLDATCVREYGENATTALANRLTETESFAQVPGAVKPGFLLAQVI